MKTLFNNIVEPVESNVFDKFRLILDILKEIKYKDTWELIVNIIDKNNKIFENDIVIIQVGVSYIAKDSSTGASVRLTHTGQRFPFEIVSKIEKDFEKFVIDFVFRIIKDAELHECAEWFRYKDKMIFNPHKGEI
jgi:hypothetical protein